MWRKLIKEQYSVLDTYSTSLTDAIEKIISSGEIKTADEPVQPGEKKVGKLTREEAALNTLLLKLMHSHNELLNNNYVEGTYTGNPQDEESSNLQLKILCELQAAVEAALYAHLKFRLLSKHPQSGTLFKTAIRIRNNNQIVKSEMSSGEQVSLECKLD